MGSARKPKVMVIESVDAGPGDDGIPVGMPGPGSEMAGVPEQDPVPST